MEEKIYYGEETAKAVQNFGSGNLPPELVIAYALVKKAVLIAVQESEKKYPGTVFECLILAVDEICEGRHMEQFIIPLKQGGAGTSINMNMNEVIANLAGEIHFSKYGNKISLDPIDDINRYQSTNDTFPTAVTIVVYNRLTRLEKSVIELQETLIKKESEYSLILITGRTEMQSALPITLGQVFPRGPG